MGYGGEVVALSGKNVLALWEGNEVFLSQGAGPNGMGSDDLHLAINGKPVLSISPDGRMWVHEASIDLKKGRWGLK